MKTSHSICLFIAFTLLTVCQAGNDLGALDGPAPFALMDLTELLKSLNTTYEELASNLKSLEAVNKQTNNQQQTQTKNSQTVSTPPTSQSTSGKSSYHSGISQDKGSQGQSAASQSSQTMTKPKATQPSSSSSNVVTPQKKIIQASTNTVTKPPAEPSPPIPEVKPSTPPLYSTTQPRSSRPAPKTTSTDQTATSSTTSSRANPQASSQSTGSSKSSPNQQSSNKVQPVPATTSSNNNPPTFGPGPDNKALPPVIDLTKIIVDYKAPSKVNTTQPKQSQVDTSNKKNQAAQSTKNQTVSQVITQKPTNVQTTAPPPPAPPVILRSEPQPTSNENPAPPSNKPKTSSDTVKKSTIVNDSPIKPPAPQPKPDTSNQVYLAPVTPQPSKPLPKYQSPVVVQPVPDSNNKLKTQADSSIQGYQCWISNINALYSITPSYQAFANYFIISANDQYLTPIQTYLINNYGTYLAGQQIIAGFKLYNNYGDNSIDYQILYLTNYGTFTSILTYSPDTSNIRLKSLSILNFFIMDVTYPNCLQKDTENKNCKVCNSGYRNFMGRCKAFDPSCSNYITDECGSCVDGKKLLQGVCR